MDWTLLTDFFNTLWGNAIVWFGGYLTFAAFIRRVSKDADDDLDPEKRTMLAGKLTSIRQQGVDTSWVPDFVELFDSFFGTKHFTWKCFFKSSMVSVFAFVFFGTIIVSQAQGGESLELTEWPLILLGLIGGGLILNAFIDYISLLQTRYFLAIKLATVIKIPLDAVVTLLISILWMSFILTILYGELVSFPFVVPLEALHILPPPPEITPEDKAIMELAGFDTSEAAVPDGLRMFEGIMIATSYTSSIWLWLYGLAGLVIRLLSGVTWLTKWLAVEKAPIRALGVMTNIIGLIIAITLFPAVIWYL